MYGVVVCPKCGRVQGVRLGAKTTTCQCGKRIYVQRTKVLFSTEDPRDLPEALGRIRAQLSGRLEEFEEALEGGPPLKRRAVGALPKHHRMGDKRKAALEILRSLSEEGSGFQLSQAEGALDASGLKGSEILQVLLRENLLYEFGKGLYRVV